MRFNVKQGGKGNGQESKRQQDTGDSGMYGTQGKRFAGHVAIHHDEKQEKYNFASGVEKV
jgi:hypothetical protein